MPAAPSQEEIRRQNLGALLRYVHRHGPSSRSEITTAMGLNRSTIGALATELANAGLVSEGAPRETGRAGRPSPVVRPESERIYAYAFSIEVDRVQAARVGLGGVILDRRELPHDRNLLTAADTLTPISSLVNQMQGTASTDGTCVGVGVSVSGLVRKDDGTVRLGPSLGWAEEPLGTALHAALPGKYSISVGNSADLAALAEHTRGAAVGCDNLIYLHGDVGVGAGIIAGGRRVTGHGGYGGEVGHMVVRPNGRPCPCGSRGCWETEIGEVALLHYAGRQGQSGHDAVLAVIDAAARGDIEAKEGVRHVGDWLGFGIANLINIFNPEMIMFGGGLRDVYLASAAQVRTRLNMMALPACREHVRLRTPTLGDDATLLGAAELAFEELLSDPLG